MSGCDSDRLEALANDEMPAGRVGGDPQTPGAVRAETLAHVAACAHCAEELGWLRAERRLFAERKLPSHRAGSASPREEARDSQAPSVAALPWAPAEPPPFTRVLAQVRRERRSRWQRWAPGLGLAAAAAFALVAMSVLGARAPAPVAAVAEPMADFTCYDDPRSLVVEATAYATDRAVASAEDHYGACLMATPAVMLGGACEYPSSTVTGAAMFTDESDVTCRPLRPLDDEVFASRICGGSLQ